METKRLSQAKRQEECNNASDLGTRFYRLENPDRKSSRFNGRREAIQKNDVQCELEANVVPKAGPALPMYPIRPASRATRCWRNSCARQRSLLDVYRFVAHRASDRKRRSSPRSRSSQNASSTLEDPRQRANPKFPKGDRRPSFSARGCMQGSEQLHWSGASQPGGPLLNGLFLRRAATLFPWSPCLQNRVSTCSVVYLIPGGVNRGSAPDCSRKPVLVIICWPLHRGPARLALPALGELVFRNEIHKPITSL